MHFVECSHDFLNSPMPGSNIKKKLVGTAHVENLTWFLIQCRSHFDGDLALFLVLCVIGRGLSRARTCPRISPWMMGRLGKGEVEREAIKSAIDCGF